MLELTEIFEIQNFLENQVIGLKVRTWWIWPEGSSSYVYLSYISKIICSEKWQMLIFEILVDKL